MFEQLTHANRAYVLDQIQCHQGFAGLHAKGIAVWWEGGKRKQGEIRRPKPEGRKGDCSGNWCPPNSVSHMACTTHEPKRSSLTSENAENSKKTGGWADGRDHLVGEDHPFPKFSSLRSLCSLCLANCSFWADPEM